jgi:hypothetical protein
MSEFSYLPDWLYRDDIRPYVFIRRENINAYPGATHPIKWFHNIDYLKLEPTKLENLSFGEAILSLEGNAFGESGMPTPKWVFYDCAIMPGVISGFAMKKESLPEKLRDLIKPDPNLEWVPISCFIAIPTAMEGQWVAHNLTSANKFLSRDERLRGLGFLSKAFGLWFTNIKKLCGVTQWGSPAIKLHSAYGNFEILTSYTPIHTHKHTFTYKSWVDARKWKRFFTKEQAAEFSLYFQPESIFIDPNNEDTMKDVQVRIESGLGPFFLSEDEIREKGLMERLQVFTLK